MPERIYLSPPHMGPDERGLLIEAFDSNWIAPLGPNVDAFEKEFATRVTMPHAAALSSGTAALHLALQLLGVGRDDEVLVSSLTFAASANPIVYQGAKPVFIDAENETWNLDPALVESELRDARAKNRRVKAVIAVDLYGQCAQLDALERICAQHEVPLIEDAAEALGATWKGRQAGTSGALAAFSFNGNKIITTSGGGMLVSRDGALIEKARFLATQARDKAAHYEHSHIGNNYRLSNLLAAVGRGQLRVLNDRIAARKAVRARYERELGHLEGITFMPLSKHGDWNGWLTVIQVDPKKFGRSREDLRLALEAANIEARPVWKPMHLQPVFREFRAVGGTVGERAFEFGLCLPSGSSLTPDQQSRVIDVFRAR